MQKVKSIATLAFVFLPLAAHAYIGPGAGLSLIGALWALLVAVAAAIVFVFAWPIRRMRRRKREAMELERQERAEPEQPARREVPDAAEPPQSVQTQETHEPHRP
jgi:membrane protein implicated in regulation of membrane protease activity